MKVTFENGREPRALHAPMTREDVLGTLRYTNPPPSSKSKQEQYIRNAEHNLDVYDDQINRLNSYIDKLRSKKVTLRRDIAFYSSMDSPVRKLSPEVLRVIFEFAADKNMFGSASGVTWNSTAFRLSAVSRRWRDVALETAELWASMDVSLEERALVPVKLALERSKNYPIDLKFNGPWRRGSDIEDGDDEEEEEEDVGITDVFPLLTANAFRWRRVYLIDLIPDLVYLWRQTTIETPILERFESREDASYLFARSFTSTPRLRHLAVVYIGYPFMDAAFPPPDITHLKLTYSQEKALVSLPNGLPGRTGIQCLRITGFNMIPLEWTGGQVDAVQDAPKEDWILSDLQNIHILIDGRNVFYSFISRFFSILTLPALSTLSITYQIPDYMKDRRHMKDSDVMLGGLWPSTFLEDCFARSRCNLTSLSLCGIPLYDYDLFSILKSTPALHTFTLHEFCASKTDIGKPPIGRLYSTVDKMFIRYLTIPPVALAPAQANLQLPLLPRLRSLTLGVQKHFDADAEFVEMVKSRWATRELRTVTLYVLHRKLATDVYEPLGTMDKEGLMVSVFSDHKRVV